MQNELSLPDTLLIRPLTVPVHAEISIPGSKSLTNRALILAALSKGKTKLQVALWAEDTELMVNALQNLGFDIKVEFDPSNICNRFIIVKGRGGEIPARKANLDVGNAGTVARFLTAFCALGKGHYKIHGIARMHQRPMKDLFDAIRSLGGKVEDTNGHLPATISGPIHGGKVSVSDSDSSQFASAMLLISKVAGITVKYPSSSYVEMTQHFLKKWKPSAKKQSIEPDASSASYFIALQHLHHGSLKIEHWPKVSYQMDHRFSKFLPPPQSVSREKDLGDSILTLVVTAAALKRHFSLTQASKLRNQECDRISALTTELRKCGVPVEEFEDGLTLKPASEFKKTTICTYHDHRIAMSFAILGTMDVMKNGQPWITIENPSCVSKTFPNFFETLEEVAKQSYQKARKDYLPVVLKTNGKPVFE